MKTLTPEEVTELRQMWDDRNGVGFERFCFYNADRLLATLEEHVSEGSTEPMTEREAYRES